MEQNDKVIIPRNLEPILMGTNGCSYPWPVDHVIQLAHDACLPHCGCVCMWVGVAIAYRDVFWGTNQLKIPWVIVVKNPNITTKGRHKECNSIINRVDFGYISWYIVTGGTYTANGALIMYYIDMMTIKGTFQMRWYSSFVAAPVFLGFFICWEDFELFSSSCDGS